MKEVSIDDKRLINCRADLNQLVPIKYDWAWNSYLNGVANTWTPNEVTMQKDISQWNNADDFSNDERHMIKRSIGYFATAETLAANNIILGMYRLISNPECRQYLLRQAFEEAVHVHCFQYISESLGLDPIEIFPMYENVKEIKDKDAFCLQFINTLTDDSFTADDDAKIRKLLEALIVFSCMMEGMFFYADFAQILSLGQTNPPRLPGCCEQIGYILRDESLHIQFGIDLVNNIRKENPTVWNNEMDKRIRDLFHEAVNLEIAYADESIKEGVSGLDKEQFISFVKWIANRRLKQLQIQPIYGDGEARNNLPWLAKMMDIQKKTNFFERQVTDYKNAGSLSWDN